MTIISHDIHQFIPHPVPHPQTSPYLATLHHITSHRHIMHGITISCTLLRHLDAVPLAKVTHISQLKAFMDRIHTFPDDAQSNAYLPSSWSCSAKKEMWRKADKDGKEQCNDIPASKCNQPTASRAHAVLAPPDCTTILPTMHALYPT